MLHLTGRDYDDKRYQRKYQCITHNSRGAIFPFSNCCAAARTERSDQEEHTDEPSLELWRQIRRWGGVPRSFVQDWLSALIRQSKHEEVRSVNPQHQKGSDRTGQCWLGIMIVHDCRGLPDKQSRSRPKISRSLHDVIIPTCVLVFSSLQGYTGTFADEIVCLGSEVAAI
jgi:hypothetical protein